jgi:hypothetical protein
MELKKFRNRYDLELIPASHEGIILGTLVRDPVIGKPVFDHPGMPDHIFNAFLDAEIISLKEWDKALESLRNVSLSKANLAISSVDVNIDIISGLDHPLLGLFSNSFKLEGLKKFSFGDLNVRILSPLLRVQIDSYLEKLKEHKWKFYDGKIRRVYIISELYYGSIKIVIDKTLKNKFNLALKNSDLRLNNELEFGTAIEYSFKHENVPFAMKLELVKGFTS